MLLSAVRRHLPSRVPNSLRRCFSVSRPVILSGRDSPTCIVSTKGVLYSNSDKDDLRIGEESSGNLMVAEAVSHIVLDDEGRWYAIL